MADFSTPGYDVISNLVTLRWASLRLDAVNIQTDFSHDLAERKYPYLDGAQHEFTGRNPFRVTATIHFNNTILVGSYPGFWNEFMDRVRTGYIDTLWHPDEVFGQFPARVVDVKQNLDAMNTGGVTVDVTWVESRLGGEFIITTVAPSAAAAAVATNIEFMDSSTVQYIQTTRKKMPEIDGEMQLDLLDMLDQLKGLASQFQRFTEGIKNRVQGFVDDVNEWAKPSTNPLAVALLESMENLEEAVDVQLDIQEKGARPTAREKLERDTTHEQFASKHKNTVDEIYQLNPGSLRFQIVPKGTVMVYYIVQRTKKVETNQPLPSKRIRG